MALPRQSSVWDERRNSSRVIMPPPNALPDALRALAKWRRENPAHAQWILDGYPTLTEAEHLERFGEPYNKPSRKRAHT